VRGEEEVMKEEVMRKVKQLYRRVRRKPEKSSRQKGRGGVRWPTQKGTPTGRPGLSPGEVFHTRSSRAQQELSTEEWLQYRGQRGNQVHYPVRANKVDHDIITVDNLYSWVPPPRGPDTFTINVESALNFAGR